MASEPDGHLVEPGSVELGVDADIDDGVKLGYHSGRPVPEALSIGRQARLRSGTVIYCGSHIGDRLQTGHNVIIREECRIGDDVSVWSNSIVDYGCVVGDGAKIHSNCYVAQLSVIEAHAFLAPGVTLANDLYPGDAASAAAMRGPVIGAGAQVGVNVTVLPYVRIGAGALVGAGAVVTRDVPPGMVAYGNPAAVVRTVASLPDIATRCVPHGEQR